MTTKKDLAPTDTPPPHLNFLEVVTGASAVLSSAQKSFKQLLASVEKAEANLQYLSSLLAVYRSRFASTIGPLQDERDGLNRDLLLFLKAQKTVKGRNKTQIASIQILMEYLAENLLGTKYEEETRGILVDPFEKSTFASADEAQFAANLEELFGVDLDTNEKEPRTTQDLYEEALRQIHEDAALNRQKAEDHANKTRGGKKNAKQAKLEQENIDAGKLIKDIYRKLTSALHPDREPDETERIRKTALMVEVNKAYAANNLLQLLRLQFQVIKVDANAAANLADEKLVLVNRSLKQQLADLEQERFMLEEMIREEFHLDYTQEVKAKILDRGLSEVKADFKEDITRLQNQFKRINQSEANFKMWLKQAKQQIEEEQNHFSEDELDAFFVDKFSASKKKRK